MTENKDKNVFYITHSGELLFWLIIILAVTVIFFISNISKHKFNNEYDIFMPDVDGLIVGSPVRSMGIEIGHIVKIKPIKDEVFVKFMIDDKDIKLPQGTIATVEFSGMAGSKSLELYLPDEKTYIDSTVPILSVSPPKRLHEAFGLLNEMFKEIGKIIAVSSQFGKKLSEINFPEKSSTLVEPDKFLKYADDIIDKSQERADNLGRALKNDKDKK